MAVDAVDRKSRRPGRGVVAEGVQLRHRRGCEGDRCSCRPGFQAQVWSARDGKPIRRTFGSLGEAKRWRAETQVALRRGTLRAPTKLTVSEAALDWLEAAEAGVVRTRSGDVYKPAALRTYRQALDRHVVPVVGRIRLSAVTRNHVQDIVDGLMAGGAAPSTVRNAILPLRAIYRRAHQRDEVATNPTLRLSLPAVRGTRDRVVRPADAAALIAALPQLDQALWATALYAGLRRGELQALRWSDVDLDTNLIRVERSWDRVAGPVEPKSRSGRRRVPLTRALRRYLAAHRLQQPKSELDLVFATRGGRPFDPPTVVGRARRAWQRAGLDRIGFHECRHTYAAFMIAAGVNPKALCTYMGHASITITLDRYGHLLPGNEHEAATMLDTFLDKADSASALTSATAGSDAPTAIRGHLGGEL